MSKRGWRLPLRTIWSVSTSSILALLVVGFVLLTNISGHMPGYSQGEIDYAAASSSLSAIVSDPVFAPHKLATWALSQIIDPAPLAARVASALFGIAVILLFYTAVRMWHGKQIGFLATVMLGGSSWLLLTARGGEPYIAASLSILLILLSGYLVSLHYRSVWSHLAVIASLSLVIYMPGMVWLLATGLVLRGKKLLRAVRELSTRDRSILLSVITLLVLVPIGAAAIRDASTLTALAGLPEQWPTALEALRTLGHALVGIGIVQQQIMPWSVGGMPLADAAVVVTACMGTLYYWQKRQLDRTRLIVAAFLLALTMVALGIPSGYAYLLPLIFILSGAGLAHLLMLWLTVFPRNALARGVGTTCIALIVAASGFYGLRAYYVAAPHADNIRQIYSHQL